MTYAEEKVLRDTGMTIGENEAVTLDARRADLGRDIAILGDCLTTARAELRAIKKASGTGQQASGTGQQASVKTTTTMTPLAKGVAPRLHPTTTTPAVAPARDGGVMAD